MAVTSHTYTRLAKSLLDKLAQLETDALKVALFSAYTVGTTQDTAQFYADVTAVATESTGTGYTAGGQALTGVSLTETNASHLYTLTCANPSWANASFSAAFAVFYDSTPATAATQPLICYWDLGGTQTVSGVPFNLTIAAGGLLNLTGA